ncbi:MAG: VWA domain-containing protein, partial [Planctomycetota bacterium]
LVGVVAFDGRAVSMRTPRAAAITDVALDSVVTGRDGTDVAGALRTAARLIPPDAAGRIVLISDGVATGDSVLEAAQEVAGARTGRAPVAVDVVPIEYEVGSEVLIEAVEAPGTAQAEATVPVRVRLRSAGPARGTLQLLYDGEPVNLTGPDVAGTGARLSLAAGVRDVTAAVPLVAGRLHRFEAVWEPDPAAAADTSPENNRAAGFTITPAAGRVAILGDVATGEPDLLADTLRSADIAVDVLVPQAAPTTLLDWQPYDLVISRDAGADDLSAASERALVAHVTQVGAGFVMLGGPRGFAAGGWKGSEIAEILPVDLDVPDRLVLPRAAVVMILDKSGSMGQSVLGSARSQQAIANEAAARALASLDSRDLVGVIAFSSGTDVVVELGPNDDPRGAGARVRSIAPGGGTFLVPAMELAQRQLAGVEADSKHVVVLTDGQSVNPEQLPRLAAVMADEGIRVSTIAVGDGADSDNLAQIASAGGGRAYRVVDPTTLPRILVNAVTIERRPNIREQPFAPVVADATSDLLAGVPSVGAGLPTLRGIVLTERRDDPGVTDALLAPDGLPVLSHWNAGLGRVAAFTSDAGVWARDWADSPVYAAFWTQLARRLARPGDAAPYELRMERAGDDLRLVIEAVGEDGVPIDGLDARATVFDPGGASSDVTLPQVGPGRYEAVVAADGSGVFLAVAQPTRSGRALTPSLAGVAVDDGIEYRSLSSDRGTLERVAQATGGRVLTLDDASAAAMFRRDGVQPRRALTPLTESLLLIAVLALLVDIGTRRVAWDRWVSRDFGVEARRVAAEVTRDRTKQASEAIAGLRKREPKPEPQVSGVGFDTADAVKLAREARERRMRDQMQASRRATESGASQPVDRGDAGAPKPDADSGGAGDLLAAKRRATRQYDQSDD